MTTLSRNMLTSLVAQTVSQLGGASHIAEPIEDIRARIGNSYKHRKHVYVKTPSKDDNGKACVDIRWVEYHELEAMRENELHWQAARERDALEYTRKLRKES